MSLNNIKNFRFLNWIKKLFKLFRVDQILNITFVHVRYLLRYLNDKRLKGVIPLVIRKSVYVASALHCLLVDFFYVQCVCATFQLSISKI